MLSTNAYAIPTTYTFSGGPVPGGPAVGNEIVVSFVADLSSVVNETLVDASGLVTSWSGTDGVTSVSNLDPDYSPILRVYKDALGMLIRYDFISFRPATGVTAGEHQTLAARYSIGSGIVSGARSTIYCLNSVPGLGCRGFQSSSTPTGQVTFTSSPLTAVMEPATFGLLALGLLALGFARHRPRPT